MTLLVPVIAFMTKLTALSYHKNNEAQAEILRGCAHCLFGNQPFSDCDSGRMPNAAGLFKKPGFQRSAASHLCRAGSEKPPAGRLNTRKECLGFYVTPAQRPTQFGLAVAA
jgi:hypothetical protein